MKKLITTVAFSLLAMLATAQVEKGAKVLFGGGGYNENTTKSENPNLSPTTTETKNTYFNLGIGGQYFLTDNISVLMAVLIYNSCEFEEAIKINNRFTGGGLIGARYYYPCMAPRFYTYGELSFSYAGGSKRTFDRSSGNETQKDKVNEIYVGINPGFSYFVTPSIALEMSFGLIGWNQSVLENDADARFRTTESDFDFLLDSKALTLGFCWFIGRKDRTFPPAS